MKEQIQELIEDYKRKVKHINELMEAAKESPVRLSAKREVYKGFIIELERILKS